MKKAITVISVMILALTFVIIARATALDAPVGIDYYDENSNLITVHGLYYSPGNIPRFNSNCYYIGDDGDPVYVGGSRVYYCDDDGKLVPGERYFDANGLSVTPPVWYLEGWGRGTYCYGPDQSVIHATYYYDDSGNMLDLSPEYLQNCGSGACWR